ALDDGELGEIGLATAEVAWHRGTDYYGVPGRGTWAVDLGGVLMIQAIHAIDFLCWTVGPVESVTALSSSFARGLEVEDTVVALMRFRSGAIGQVTATVGAQSNRSTLALYGTRAAAISCGETYSPTAEAFRLEVAGQPAEEPSAPERGAGTQPGPVLHMAQVRDFVEAIQTGREPLVTAASCRASLELIAAMQRSAATGERVELPLAKDDPYYRLSPDKALG
ncbi:MAG: Gfo/Idh/MocA family oxidoreductase, partial [Dehalococcoidia bacterium]